MIGGIYFPLKHQPHESISDLTRRIKRVNRINGPSPIETTNID
jgi:hypothetical protein